MPDENGQAAVPDSNGPSRGAFLRKEGSMITLRGRPIARSGLFVLALSVASWRPAAATSIEPMTMQETVRDAAAIFVGRVLEHRSRWGDASQTWMVTNYTFQVEDTVLGSGEVRNGRTVVLPFWGGTIDGETQEAAGV